MRALPSSAVSVAVSVPMVLSVLPMFLLLLLVLHGVFKLVACVSATYCTDKPVADLVAAVCAYRTARERTEKSTFTFRG